MARAECSSALMTEAYESENLVYFPTRAMEHCSNSLSDLWRQHRSDVLTRIITWHRSNSVWGLTCQTSPSIWSTFSWVESLWACWVSCSGSPPHPDSPAVMVLCRWTTRRARRWPRKAWLGEFWGTVSSELMQQSRVWVPYLLGFHMAEHWDLFFDRVLQSRRAATHDLVTTMKKKQVKHWLKTWPQRTICQTHNTTWISWPYFCNIKEEKIINS